MRRINLIEPGANKIAVISAIRNSTNLSLKEAKDLVDGVPSSFEVEDSVAHELIGQLRSKGAVVQSESDSIAVNNLGTAETSLLIDRTELATSPQMSKKDNKVAKQNRGVYRIFGEEFKVTQGMKNYLEYVHYSTSHREQFVKDFVADYSLFYPSPEKWFEKTSEKVKKQLDAAAESAQQFVTANGCYTTSPKDFYAQDANADLLESMISIQEEMFDIIAQGDEEKAYRAERKENRARAVGFGFGLGGYIKGSMQAGAINAATGLGHSLANAIGNSNTTKETKAKLKEVIRSQKTEDTLTQRLNYCIANTYSNALMYLMDHGIEFDVLDFEKADNILHNYQRIPAEKKPSALLEAIRSNYICQEAYQLILDDFPQEFPGVDGVTRELGMDFSGPVVANFNAALIEWRRKYDYSRELEIQPLEKVKELIRLYDELDDAVQLCEWPEDLIQNRIPDYFKVSELYKEVSTRYQGEEFASQTKLLGALEELEVFFADIIGKDLTDVRVTNTIETSYGQYPILSAKHRPLLERAVKFATSLQDPERIAENLNDICQRFGDNDGLQKFVLSSAKPFGGIMKKIEKQIAFEPDETIYFLYHDGADQLLLGRNSGFVFTSKNIYAYDITLLKKGYEKILHEDVDGFIAVSDNLIRCQTKEGNQALDVSVSNSALKEKYLYAINSAWDLVRVLDGYKGGGLKPKTVAEIAVADLPQLAVGTEGKKETAFCVYCGGKILRTAKFCNYCGKANAYKEEL